MPKGKLEFERIELEQPKVTVYRLEGDLTGGSESYEFLEEVRTQIRKGACPVVINLEAVEHVNSAGIGILAACYTSVTNAAGRLCVSGASKRLRTILEVVKLTEVLCVLPTEEEAIRKITS